MKHTILNSRPFGVRFAVPSLAAAFVLGVAGCSTTTATPSDPPPAASAQAASIQQVAPAPDVAHCAIVTLSTPTLYACGGKVYTVYQLQQLREQAAAAKAGG